MTIFNKKSRNKSKMDANCSSELSASTVGVEDLNMTPDNIDGSSNSTQSMLSPDALNNSISSLTNVSRYGRTRKQKTITDFLIGDEYSVKPITKSPKSVTKKKTLDKKMSESPENKLKSPQAMSSTPHKNKVYIVKDLSQRNKEETVNIMRNMFSPVKNTNTSPEVITPIKEERSSPSPTPISLILKKSPEGSFVCSPKKNNEIRSLSNELDDIFIKSEYDVSDDEVLTDEQDCGWIEGELAWARVGGHPLWPCLITRDRYLNTFVKKKTVGRSIVSQYALHVTFFADNGRHSWLLNSFLLRFHGLDDFLDRKRKITSEMRKKDPKYYAAFDVKENKKTKWHSAVTEAEMLLRRPPEVREQFLITFKENAIKHPKKYKKKTPKIEKDKNNSVLSESLFDSLFNGETNESHDEEQKPERLLKQDDSNIIITSKITKHQNSMSQTHMDKWLMKAKSENLSSANVSDNNSDSSPDNSAIACAQSSNDSVNLDKPKEKITNNNDILPDVKEIKTNDPNMDVICNGNTQHTNQESDTGSSSSTVKSKRIRKTYKNEKKKLSRKILEDSSDVGGEHNSINICENIISEPKYENPVFQQFLAVRKDAFMDERPDLDEANIISYLYNVWEYGESQTLDEMKNSHSVCLVKGMADDITSPPPKKIRKNNTDNQNLTDIFSSSREKCIRKKAVKSYVPDDLSTSGSDDSDYEAVLQKGLKEVEVDEKEISGTITENNKDITNDNVSDDTKSKGSSKISISERYMESLKATKPSIFKGLSKEKVCEICEAPGNLVKCKGPCQGMFHKDCVKNQDDPNPANQNLSISKRGRKPKAKNKSDGKSANESCNGDEKDEDDVKHDSKSIVEPCLNGQINIPPSSFEAKDIYDDENKTTIVENVAEFESQISQKMLELLEKETNMDSLDNTSISSEDCDWSSMQAGECVIVDAKVMKSKKKTTNNSPEPNDSAEIEVFKCNHCVKSDTPLCSVCKSVADPKTGNEFRQRCNVMHCHQFYHLECLKVWPQTKYSTGTSNKGDSKNNTESVSCPRHVCHTCVSDDPQGCKTRFSGDKLARCVKCPATYHCFTKCVPAGTRLITASQIICPRHTEKSSKAPYHVNTAWCFICAKGGTLVCCETCPTSFHAECLNVPLPEGGYICEDCETGRLPLYEELVWVKLGQYRWWPALILHPSDIPPNIYSLPHQLGQFAVRFFGIYDHYWISGGRVFPYQEGDTGHASSKKSSIDSAFMVAVKQAQKAFEIMKEIKAGPDDNELSASLLPPKYVKLKVNRAIGGAIAIAKNGDKAGSSKCDCNPNSDNPCSPDSDCLNRMLLTECSPNVCAAGQRCCNQSFEKRLYPPLEPSRTSSRGWGLKVLADIKKGDFIIEYVGEVIDEQEFQRRMMRRQETRDENYYFLTLDKDRMIDAGPKGNVARFMNHSCEPNCETQKWTVNGDTRVGLFALEDISAGTELTFNYNLTCAGDDKKKCLCGTKRCAGYIGAKPKQEEVVPKKTRKYQKRKNRKRANNSSVTSTSKSNLKARKNSSEKEIDNDIEPEGIDKDVAMIKRAIIEQEATKSALTNGDVSDEEKKSSLEGSNEVSTNVDKVDKKIKTETDDYPLSPVMKDVPVKTNSSLIGKRKRLSLQLNNKTKNSPTVSNKRTRSNSVQFSECVVVIEGNDQVSFNQDIIKPESSKHNGFNEEELKTKKKMM